MKLMIDIPEEDYIRLRDEGMFGNVTTFKRAVREGIPLEQEPCEDAISRQYLIERATSWDKHFTDSERYVSLTDIQNAPLVAPAEKVGQKIDAEVLDKIRAEIIKYEGDCRLSVDEYSSCKQCTDNTFETIYAILDKYKAEGSDKE